MPDTLDSIPADVTMPMTEELQRLFRFAKCDPTCHACGEKIKVGDDFKLVSVKHTALATGAEWWVDEMACSKHGRVDLERGIEARWQAARQQGFVRTHSGYSRPSAVMETL